MISLLVTLLVVCLVLSIAWWALSQIPLPQPFRAVVVVILALIAIIVLLGLLPIGGGSLGHWQLR